jgi:hypothetical protein
MVCRDVESADRRQVKSPSGSPQAAATSNTPGM